MAKQSYLYGKIMLIVIFIIFIFLVFENQHVRINKLECAIGIKACPNQPTINNTILIKEIPVGYTEECIETKIVGHWEVKYLDCNGYCNEGGCFNMYRQLDMNHPDITKAISERTACWDNEHCMSFCAAHIDKLEPQSEWIEKTVCTKYQYVRKVIA